jgi:hypothetical protein
MTHTHAGTDCYDDDCKAAKVRPIDLAYMVLRVNHSMALEGQAVEDNQTILARELVRYRDALMSLQCHCEAPGLECDNCRVTREAFGEIEEEWGCNAPFEFITEIDRESYACELPEGHSGKHQAGTVRWLR